MGTKTKTEGVNNIYTLYWTDELEEEFSRLKKRCIKLCEKAQAELDDRSRLIGVHHHLSNIMTEVKKKEVKLTRLVYRCKFYGQKHISLKRNKYIRGADESLSGALTWLKEYRNVHGEFITLLMAMIYETKRLKG